YYAYSLGDWRVIVLNTNDGGCRFVRCDEGSEQLAWLREELARQGTASCTLAYWHHPRFSSGDHGDAAYVDALWRTLAGGGVDVALNGHDHHYERFAPMNGDGEAAPAGMRAFIVGTGGGEYYPIRRVSPNSVVRQTGVSGVLELTLRPDGYDWAFDAVAISPGAPFSDRGAGSCH
ncbi:MAG: metallophosphoesterase family protein, partial [Chloroflexota bacterium]